MRRTFSGAGPVSVVSCAIILLTTVTGALGASAGVKSDDAYCKAAPVISEPSAVRAPIGAGAATYRPTDYTPRNICLDFHAADIADVLKALSVQSTSNIVTSPDVKGQVTVSLNKVTFGEAMDTITKLAGLKYAMTGSDTYVVGSAAAVANVQGIASQESITATIPLAYASGKDVMNTLQVRFPELKCGAPEKEATAGQTSFILLSGPRDTVQAAKEVVLSIEEALKADANLRVSEVVDLRFANADQVIKAIALSFPTVSAVVGPTTGFTQRPPQNITFTSAGLSTSDAWSKQDPTQDAKSIVLCGDPIQIAKAKAIIAQMDIRPKQVLIEAKVADITIGDEKRLGISWSWTSIGFSERTNDNGGGNGSFTRLPFDIEGSLDAMFANNDAKLLANPTIATLDGRSATVFIGDELKYVVGINVAPNGQSTFQTETAIIGITLRVIARPDSDGYITLALHPEVSAISDWLSFTTGTGGNNNEGQVALPQIARRYTDHMVRVRDGETIAIGGLIRDQEINNLSKIPFLGDLPFLGNLFKHREKTKTHSDVAIFIKASVMKDS